ncbi:MAG TPA: AAA family ATPase, partial [Myxococcaceae bacterium]
MEESLKRYTDDTRRSHGVEVQIRVGLNSGEVVVRSVGSDLRMDYTAVGQTTHLAARMEQLAPPGTVRLTGETVRLAEGYVEVRSLGPIPVKGLPDPIEIFELTGAGTARTRLQAAALRGLTRFVGRDAEVEHLRRVLGQAAAGRGQVVAIVGEAGVGKSRLTYEFTHSHRVQGWLILESSSVSYGKATSYLPVVDLLKGYFKIGDRDDHREMRAKVLGGVLGLDRALEPLLPPLLALLDVPVDDPAWQTLDPPQRRQRTLDAVKRLLLRESQAQPLLVVFEDLQWIDGETQALLDSLVDSLGSVRLLLLVNYRPEYAHRWGSKTAYSQLRLDTLPAESAAELLAALLGLDPGLVPLTQMLVKRGNPFFLEETVRTLVETGALDGPRGGYRLTRPVEAIEVPATVQVILAARIDRLLPDDKQLLQTASVIGKDVPLVLLHAVAGAPEEALQRGLANLQAAEFLYETRLFPEPEYTFKHALTHQVAYGGLLHGRRRELHARIVDAMERLYPDRLAEQVERLASHALR